MMDAMDEINLTGLRASAFHGVLEHERRTGQVFIIDVTVHLDLAAAAQSVAAVESDPVDLIETVAERIATVVLAHAPARLARVTVHKPSAPIAVPFEDVSVTITRVKAQPQARAGFGRN
jgi:dihydroneopterin aldolase